jgi:hypothetical protein
MQATAYKMMISRAEDVLKIGTNTPSYLKKINANIGKMHKRGMLTTGGAMSAKRAACLIDTDMMHYSTIKSIKEIGKEDVYDIEVKGGHNFVADGIVVHNSNYREARESFWEDTVTWYLQLLQSELNNWLLPDDKFYLMPMLDDSPAMEAKKNKNLRMAQICDFLTINEKRTLAGFPPITGGDVMLGGWGMMPLLGDDVDETAKTEDELADEEDKARRELMRIVGDEAIAASLMQGDYND